MPVVHDLVWFWVLYAGFWDKALVYCSEMRWRKNYQDEKVGGFGKCLGDLHLMPRLPVALEVFQQMCLGCIGEEF